jgi:hypothetical protein
MNILETALVVFLVYRAVFGIINGLRHKPWRKLAAIGKYNAAGCCTMCGPFPGASTYGG